MNIYNNIYDIYPGSIDNRNFRYLKIDNIYSSSILITNFPKYTSFLQIINSIPKNYLYDMSIFIRKQDNMKVLKELTYYISSSASEIKTSNKNQIDIDLLSRVKEDAKELRKQIQINEQEIFFVNIIITFYSGNKQKLFEKVKEFQSIIYSKNLNSSIANFRHLDTYLLNLPLNKNKEKILELNERNFTTDSISNVFPFYTKSIFDENGVIFGFTQDENKLCNIDIFNKKYINANMCVFGSSGSGKSFFVKLMVIRLFFNGKNQYIIDPEGEYINIAKTLNCNYLEFYSKTPKYFFNFFEILEYEIYLYKENIINYKINKILKIICFLCNIKNKFEIEEIERSVKILYKNFNIINVESVYKQSNENRIYVEKEIKNSDEFPTICELLKYINSEKLKEKISKHIILKYPIFSKHTNLKLNSRLNIFNTNNLNQKDDIFFVNEITNIILENLKYKKYKYENKVNDKLNNNINGKLNKKYEENNLNNTIIYIDEIWKYIKKDKNNNKINLGNKIFELFKTIRKYNASIVAITQDISDFFLFEEGNYGKSIINNSSFKIYFKLDFSDGEFFKKYYILNDNQLYKINRLDKGQSMICFKNSVITLNIKANEYEKEILKEDFNENYNCT